MGMRYDRQIAGICPVRPRLIRFKVQRTLPVGKKSYPNFVQLNTLGAAKCSDSLCAKLSICVVSQMTLLDIYMCKSVDRGMSMTYVKLMEKCMGGEIGSFVAD